MNSYPALSLLVLVIIITAASGVDSEQKLTKDMFEPDMQDTIGPDIVFIDSESISDAALFWGQIGHYVTGRIAENHLTDEASHHISRILGETSLPRATTWMDEIRSDPRYNHTHEWHWVDIPPGMTYEETEKNPNGDAIVALERKIGQLMAGGVEMERERELLKMVIHLIGDIHQPLHVGTGEDRGGNDVRVHWMGQSSNLHRVWDTDMIESFRLSYSEFAREIDHATDEEIKHWQQSSVRDWAMESKSWRDRVYDLPDNLRLGWEYRYNNFDIVEKRLLQAGVRIAGVINEIYGSG